MQTLDPAFTNCPKKHFQILEIFIRKESRTYSKSENIRFSTENILCYNFSNFLDFCPIAGYEVGKLPYKKGLVSSKVFGVFGVP